MPDPEAGSKATGTATDKGKDKGELRASLCFSGPMWSKSPWMRSVMLAEDYGVAADTWAVTSWTNLRTEALEVERWNRLHPEAEPRTANITATLGAGRDPVLAITDYMRSVPDQVARFVDRPYLSLGTDGFGRSDARDALRSYFEVDSANLVVAVLQQLALGGQLKPSVVAGAVAEFGIETDGDAPPSSSPDATVRTGLLRPRVSIATNAARASSAPSGTARTSVRRSACNASETSKKGQHCFSRWASATAAVSAASDGSAARGARRRRHPPPPRSPRTPPGPARLRRAPQQRPGPGCRRAAPGSARLGPPAVRRRHRRRLATSASRVSSICPQCWNSSSRMWTSTAPLLSV